MNQSWLFKPVIFFGRRIYIFFAAIMSVPVWLAANTLLDGMSVPDDEAAATGVTMCFFAGIFTGRYIAVIWTPYLQFRPRKLVMYLAIFIFVCLCWLFIHADNPLGETGLNLLLYLLPFLAMSLGTGILIKMVRMLAEKQLHEAQSSAAQSESELKLLQSQLSPHFLFNTLNNMYGLSLTQHEKIPPLILKLSDLLSYSVYESNKLFVPLKSELDYIHNYIEFEKIRLGERLNLETDIELPVNEKHNIAPMLLIVFIENAFKHSKNSPDELVRISISLKTWNNRILFSVKNSHDKQGQRFDSNSGFGLDNVRKRLDLLYPGTYTLDITDEDRLYTVMLQLKNNE